MNFMFLPPTSQARKTGEIYAESPHKTLFFVVHLFFYNWKVWSFDLDPGCPYTSLKRRRGIKSVLPPSHRGVTGGAVPTHDAHPETWHALLSGIKAWWLSPPGDGEVQQVQHFKGV